MTEIERRDVDRFDRELAEIRAEIRRIDDHGTRGILPLTVQMTEVIKDVASVEKIVTAIQEKASKPRWGMFLAYVGAVLPIDLFVIQQILSGRH